MMYDIRIATQYDIEYISLHMRESDVVEIYASHRRYPEELLEACKGIQCLVATKYETPFCLFGCNLKYGYGMPWLLATDEIEFNSVWFLKQSKRLLKEWLEEYGILTNYIYAKNYASIEWLKWLKFDFPEEVTINDEPFLRFEKRGAKYV